MRAPLLARRLSRLSRLPLVAPLALAPIALAPSTARAAEADEGLLFVSPGYLYAKVAGDAPATAHGLELSVHYLDPKSGLGVGGFAQLQRYDGDHDRFAGGAQVTYAIAGLELGYAHRDAGGGPASPSGLLGGDVTTHRSQTSGLHLAPFVSFGFLYFALRWTIPLAEGARPTQGAEHAFTVGVKVPLQLRGASVWKGLADALSFGGH